MRSSSAVLASALFLIPCNSVLFGAALPRIDLPADSPVVLLSADYGESNEMPRGSAMLLDVHAALSLRNSSQRKIRGITLLVTAQAVIVASVKRLRRLMCFFFISTPRVRPLARRRAADLNIRLN